MSIINTGPLYVMYPFLMHCPLEMTWCLLTHFQLNDFYKTLPTLFYQVTCQLDIFSLIILTFSLFEVIV